MLFQVEMNIRIPPDADPEKIKAHGAGETAPRRHPASIASPAQG